MMRFLGAKADAETARRCVEKSSFEKWSGGRERGDEDSSIFYRKGVAGDRKNVFTHEDWRVFKKAAGDLLIRLGYERDDGW